MQWLLLGMPAFGTLSAFTTRILDVAADGHAPVLVEARDARVWSSYRRKVGTEYHVRFDSDDERVDDSSPLQIDRATYDALRARWHGAESPTITIAWHPGALDLPWVEVAR